MNNFYIINLLKNENTTINTKRKKKLQERFEKMDKDPHINYRIIAYELAKDYKRLLKKCKKLEENL